MLFAGNELYKLVTLESELMVWGMAGLSNTIPTLRVGYRLLYPHCEGGLLDYYSIIEPRVNTRCTISSLLYIIDLFLNKTIRD